MPNPLGPVSPGDDMNIAAVAWNAAMDAARDFRQPGRPDDPAQKFRTAGYIEAMALNSTGAGLDAFKPAKVTGAGDYTLTASESQAFDWTKRPAVTLSVPTAATDQIAVTLEPILDGKYGRVAIAGWVPCDVDVSSMGHAYAVPTTDTDALVSAPVGTIPIKATGTGTARRTQVYLGDQWSLATSNSDGTQAGMSGDVRFNQATGIKKTKDSPSAGIDKVQLLGATTTQMGAVTTGNQAWAGNKTVVGAIASYSTETSPTGAVTMGGTPSAFGISCVATGPNTFDMAQYVVGGVSGGHTVQITQIGRQDTGGSSTRQSRMDHYTQSFTAPVTGYFLDFSATQAMCGQMILYYGAQYLTNTISACGISFGMAANGEFPGSIPNGVPQFDLYSIDSDAGVYVDGRPIRARRRFLFNGGTATSAAGSVESGIATTARIATNLAHRYSDGLLVASYDPTSPGSPPAPPVPPVPPPPAGSIGTTELANNAVTYAKMQDVSAASRLIGRGAGGGSGDPQELSLDSSLALSGTTLAVGVVDAGTW